MPSPSSSSFSSPSPVTAAAASASESHPVFELDAGRVCLDFANTLGATSGEHLRTYTDLLAFARQAHLLTPADADRLQRHAERDPHAARQALQRALTLRDAVRDIFSAIATSASAPAEPDLAVLNAHLERSLSHARVVPAEGDATDPADQHAQHDEHDEHDEDGDDGDDGDDVPRYTWAWASHGDLEFPLWPIARSAAELLTNASELRLMRQCGGAACEWLFLDTSKNRSRQWCSMRSCGNREKARRHYQRVKAARATQSATAGRGVRRP